MPPRTFLAYPDPRLATVCQRVLRVDDAVRAVWDEMIRAMYKMPGVGLAAPQIGVMRRLAVVDCTEDQSRPIRMANPEIVWTSSESATRKEGSPNIPGVWAEVSRPASVRVRFLDSDGAEQEKLLSDLWATSVQHQIDHLDGKLFIDRLKPVKRRLVMEKLKKQRQKAQRGAR